MPVGVRRTPNGSAGGLNLIAPLRHGEMCGGRARSWRVRRANRAAPGAPARRARERGCGLKHERQQQQFQLGFGTVFGASGTPATAPTFSSMTAPSKFIKLLAARLAPKPLKGSPLISRPNSAQTRVPARRNLMPSTKSAASMKVSPRAWRIAAGSMSERAGAQRGPRRRFQ